jgi:5-formyltetrahydrofolate cyclo-ligase
MVDKQRVRERVWSLLERSGQARFPGARGRIPNFRGAERAAELLAAQPEWVAARSLKSNPDAPQLPVRVRALAGAKALYVAVPRLRSAKPFLLLDPKRLSVAPRRAASIGGAAEHGRPVTVRQVRRLDLVVCGTVAVNRGGVRVGKGGGYSDLELALLVEAGRIDDRTVVATTVHPLQVLDENLPETAHDFRVDLILTPEEVIRVPRRRRKRPHGILWDHLDPEKVDSIPVLRSMARR